MLHHLVLSVLLLLLCCHSSPLPSAEQGSSLKPRAGVLRSSVTSPWPAIENTEEDYRIQYCFHTTGDKDIDGKVAGWFALAIDLWKSPPVVVNAGRIFKFPIEYKKLSSCPSVSKTNPFLAVYVTDGDQVFTTLDYHDDKEHKMEIGREFLDIDTSDSKKLHKRVGRIAHELGRNMGLPNDNQVSSKEYEIDCRNVNGYAEMEARDKDKADRACSDLSVAEELGWKEAIQLAPFTKRQIVSSPTGPWYWDYSKRKWNRRWDSRSIMVLSATSYGRKSRLTKTRKNVMRMKINHDPPPVNWYNGPSLYDLEALLKFYHAGNALNNLNGLVHQAGFKDFWSMEECGEDPPKYAGNRGIGF